MQVHGCLYTCTLELYLWVHLRSSCSVHGCVHWWGLMWLRTGNKEENHRERSHFHHQMQFCKRMQVPMVIPNHQAMDPHTVLDAQIPMHLTIISLHLILHMLIHQQTYNHNIVVGVHMAIHHLGHHHPHTIIHHLVQHHPLLLQHLGMKAHKGEKIQRGDRCVVTPFLLGF